MCLPEAKNVKISCDCSIFYPTVALFFLRTLWCAALCGCSLTCSCYYAASVGFFSHHNYDTAPVPHSHLTAGATKIHYLIKAQMKASVLVVAYFTVTHKQNIMHPPR